MKAKLVEITEIDAKFMVLRVDTAATFIMFLAVLLLVAIKVVPLEGGELTAVIFLAVSMLFVGMAVLLVTSLSKTGIQALNILNWGIKKFTLKEVKKDE